MTRLYKAGGFLKGEGWYHFRFIGTFDNPSEIFHITTKSPDPDLITFLMRDFNMRFDDYDLKGTKHKGEHHYAVYLMKMFPEHRFPCGECDHYFECEKKTNHDIAPRPCCEKFECECRCNNCGNPNLKFDGNRICKCGTETFDSNGQYCNRIKYGDIHISPIVTWEGFGDELVK